MAFTNCYEDGLRADEYAKLEFANTYDLAFRDLPPIIEKHVSGTKAIDFGCGTGRSTRFIRQLGFEVVGIDIAPKMIARAREFDPNGDYRLIAGEGLQWTSTGRVRFDLIAVHFRQHRGRRRQSAALRAARRSAAGIRGRSALFRPRRSISMNGLPSQQEVFLKTNLPGRET